MASIRHKLTTASHRARSSRLGAVLAPIFGVRPGAGARRRPRLASGAVRAVAARGSAPRASTARGGPSRSPQDRSSRSGTGTASRGGTRGGRRGGSSFLDHRGLRGTLRVVVALSVLLLVNLYVLYYRRGTSVPDLLRAAEVGRQSSLLPGLDGPPGTPPRLAPSRKSGGGEGVQREYGRVEALRVTEDGSLKALLEHKGIHGTVVTEAQAALQKATGAHLHAGEQVVLYYDAEERLYALDYLPGEALLYHMERANNPGSTEHFTLAQRDGGISQRTTVVRGVVVREGGLADAVVKAGESRALAGALAEVWAHDLELPSGSKSGDRFAAVVEKVFVGKAFYRYGRVLAARYEPATGAAQQAYLFAPEGGEPGYYTPEGEPLARSLRKTALRVAGPARTADERRPRLHVDRAHGVAPGADYPAPAGTPVLALRGGRVSVRAARGVLGNTVVLAHGDGEIAETSYGHLARFARGLVEGQQVRAGQVIGYVGAGERGKAPHLHLGVRVAGKAVDPLRLRPVRAARLAAADQTALGQVIGPLQPQLGGKELVDRR